MATVLDGIRIIDFTRVLAGPFATRILADYGAEVIKIQPTFEEETENWAKGYYNNWNRNKLGISLNLSQPGAIDIVKKLIKISDVVMENFSPRVMANWKLDYSNLKKVRPDIIMVSLSAMGHTGAWRNYVGFGPTIQAFSGITHLTSFSGKPALGMGTSFADHVAGLFAAVAVLAALEYRLQTGKGQYIDISQLEAMCTLLAPTLMDCAINGEVARPLGNSSARAAPYGVYRCHGDDRWCAIAVFSDEEWQAFCSVLGNPAWCKQSKFATLSSRLENTGELNQLVEDWTRQHSAEEVMVSLQQAGIAAGVVQSARDIAQDIQLEARNFFIQLDHPELGRTTMDGMPIKLSRTSPNFRCCAPTLGRDNNYVLRNLLRLSEEEIAANKSILS